MPQGLLTNMEKKWAIINGENNYPSLFKQLDFLIICISIKISRQFLRTMTHFVTKAFDIQVYSVEMSCHLIDVRSHIKSRVPRNCLKSFKLKHILFARRLRRRLLVSNSWSGFELAWLVAIFSGGFVLQASHYGEKHQHYNAVISLGNVLCLVLKFIL